MKKKTIAVTGLLVLALTGVGASAAMASTSTPPTTPSVSTPVTSTPAGPKSDAEVPDSTEVAGPESATESATAGDGNDGGHADPEGVEVNNKAGGTGK